MDLLGTTDVDRVQAGDTARLSWTGLVLVATTSTTGLTGLTEMAGIAVVAGMYVGPVVSVVADI